MCTKASEVGTRGSAAAALRSQATVSAPTQPQPAGLQPPLLLQPLAPESSSHRRAATALECGSSTSSQ